MLRVCRATMTSWVWGTRRPFSSVAATEVGMPSNPAPPPVGVSGSPPGAAAHPLTPSLFPTGRSKGKNHFKRASEVMSSVKLDAMHRMFVKMYGFRPPLPDFRVGDGVEVSYAQEIAEVSPLPVRGTIMSLSRKGIDAKFTIINSLDGEWYTATYTTSSPLLRGVKILQRNRVNEGLKPVRRAKLTYLKEADPNRFSVDANTKDALEKQEEKEAKRKLQRSGKLVKKVVEKKGVSAKTPEKAAAPAAAGKAAAPPAGKK